MIDESENDDEDDLDFSFTWVPLEFAQDRKDRRVIWLIAKDVGAGTCFYVPPNPDLRWGDKHPLTGEWAERLVEAFEAARQERFEAKIRNSSSHQAADTEFETTDERPNEAQLHSLCFYTRALAQMRYCIYDLTVEGQVLVVEAKSCDKETATYAIRKF